MDGVRYDIISTHTYEGGLGLINIECQLMALSTKHLSKFIHIKSHNANNNNFNDENLPIWFFSTRFFIGNQLFKFNNQLIHWQDITGLDVPIDIYLNKSLKSNFWDKRLPEYLKHQLHVAIKCFSVFEGVLPPTNKDFYNEIYHQLYGENNKPSCESKWGNFNHWGKILELFFDTNKAYNCNKMQETTWRIIHKIIPTYEHQYEYTKRTRQKCKLCGKDWETLQHLFKNCSCLKIIHQHFDPILEYISKKTDLSISYSLLPFHDVKIQQRRLLALIVTTINHFIWVHRNDVVHNRVNVNGLGVKCKIQSKLSCNFKLNLRKLGESEFANIFKPVCRVVNGKTKPVFWENPKFFNYIPQ